MESPRFRIFKSNLNSQFYWHLQAANGEKILSGEGYTTKQSCLQGIASVIEHAANAGRYERHDNYMNYTFNLKAANGEVIGRSENYYTAHGRDYGVEAVKRCSRAALIRCIM
jgi:uncharacterized protein YegP (UPF0339 family)